ncbi:N-acetyltransferase [Rhodobacteraceae bacterium RKSG542]|nr:N-acetyltransferase [Pseudovibrio flavus]
MTDDARTSAPTLTTTRLILRAHTRSDWQHCNALWQEPAIYENITGSPCTPDQSWARLLRYAGLWSLLGYGYWAVELKETGAYVGEVGFADFKRMIEPSIAGHPEMGWIISSKYHGIGIGKEATGAAIGWAREHLTGQTAVAITGPDNKASIGLAKSLGFHPRLLTEFAGEPTLLLEQVL